MKIVVMIVAFVFVITVIHDIIKDTFDIFDNIEEETKCCSGCKYLDYYNDGSPCCTKNVDNACIKSGFSFREENNDKDSKMDIT